MTTLLELIAKRNFLLINTYLDYGGHADGSHGVLQHGAKAHGELISNYKDGSD